MKFVAALFAGLLIAACGSPTPSSSPLPSGLYALPAIDTSGWDACAGVGVVDAHLSGRPDDPRVVWLDGNFGRKEVVFPQGFSGRLTPALEILDPSGRVIAREGTVIDGGCVTGGDTPRNDHCR